jgi:hypothetical protein
MEFEKKNSRFFGINVNIREWIWFQNYKVDSRGFRSGAYDRYYFGYDPPSNTALSTDQSQSKSLKLALFFSFPRSQHSKHMRRGVARSF